MIEEIFGAQGLLAKGSPDYEVRPGQVSMARAVERAIGEKRHLAVEAPCGVGKTFAYLAPAILNAIETDTRVVVCTANIALQEQIFRKDLPALRERLGRPFTAALIKGLNNYLCLDRLEETKSELPTVTFDREELRHYRQVVEWAGDTKTGDVSDLDFEPMDAVWHRVNGVSELCNGSQCRFFDECFAMDARRKLRGAQVIVANYHLFFAHLRVKSFGAPDSILPPAPVVICDEAHEMADIARDFFGFRLTPFSINTLVRGANWLRKGGTADALRRASREFFDRVREHPEKRLRKARWVDAGKLLETVGDYMTVLKEAQEDNDDEEAIDKLGKFGAAAQGFVDTLMGFLSPEDPNCVYWIDRDDRSARLQARMIDVGPTLQEQLFKTTPSVVLTSATLTANGQFDFLKRETGADALREVSVPSPFDFREQALLVIPPMRSGPNDTTYAVEMSESINRILRHLKGRTMCLFTSYRNLEACADRAEETGVRILRQGDLPRSKLLDEFRKDGGTALFATSSFWQGVDIPGEALSCLVIDKIPFLNPGDPLLEALQERDPNCFSSYSLPKATLDLRQGFGRLIRRRSDRGVVVIFDNRLLTKKYGAEVLASLPGCPMTRDLGALEKFFPRAGAPVE